MPRPNRRAEILQAASEEFREHGYDNATLEGIGARVGILKGSIYNYVSSKEELLFAVVEQPAQRLLTELGRVRDADHRDVPIAVRLRELFRMQMQIFSEYYPAAFVYLQHVRRASQSEAFRKMDDEYMAAVEGLLADGAARGELSLPTTPRIAARALVGMLDWMQHWFHPRGPEADLRLADDLFALAMGGLSAGGSARALLRAVPVPPEEPP